MPLGNLPSSFLNLLVGFPQINWVFIYRVNENLFEFDDLLIKKELDGISLSEPAVLSFLRKELEFGFENLQPEKEY